MMQVTLMDGDDDGSAYILDVTPEEANRLKTDMGFSNKMLNKAKYIRFMEEISAEESFAPNESVSVGQNKTLPMEQNINIETDNNVFKWPHEAILLLIEEYRKRTDDFYSGHISQKKKIGKI